MIISDQNGGYGHPPEHFRTLAEWCGIQGEEGEMWMRHFLPGKVVGLERGGLERVGFRFKNGDVHHRSLASVSGPVADKMFRWEKAEDTEWLGGKRFWSPCPPPLPTLRSVLLVEGETSAVAAAYALALRSDWWVVATTGAGMFPEKGSVDWRTLRGIMYRSSAVAVAWPDDDAAGGRWLEGAAGLLKGRRLGVVKTSGDPRSVWRTMLEADGLDAATGKFWRLADEAAAAAVAVGGNEAATKREEGAPSGVIRLDDYRPALREADWKPPVGADRGRREEMPRGALRSWLAGKHSVTDSLVRAGAHPGRGKGNLRCFNVAAHKSGDRNPSLSVFNTGENEAFRCFGCGEKGDIVRAYALGHHGGDEKAAARCLYEEIRSSERMSG